MKTPVKKTPSFFKKNKKLFFGFFVLPTFMVAIFLGGIDITNAQAPSTASLTNPSLAPAATASGSSWVDTIISLPTSIPLAIVGTIWWAVSGIARALANFAFGLTQWVLSDGFTKLSYTNPKNNEIIKVGLDVTMSFVNMLLVVALVYIALATILRLAGYETRKALVSFIIIAILVNFAPTICGLAVDASNIVMNFFVNGVKDKVINPAAAGDVAAKTSVGIAGMWGDALKLDSNKVLIQISFFGVSSVVYIFTFFIYMLFAFIFIGRHIALWLLTILSPIAFACYALPFTKKYFNDWREQFVEWTMIGINCAFFLYLAQYFTSQMLVNTNSSLYVDPSKVQSYTQVAGTLLPMFVPLVFLLFGLLYGMRTSAWGTGAIIGLMTGKAMSTAKGVSGIPVKYGKKAGGAALGAAGYVAGKAGGRIGTAIRDKAGFRDIAGWTSRKLEGNAITRWAVPDSLRKYSQYRGGVEKEKEKLKSFSNMDVARRLAVGDLKGEAATAGLAKIMSEGDSQDLVNAYKKQYGIARDEDLFKDARFKAALSRPLQIAQNSGMLSSSMMRKDPRMARLLAGQSWMKKYAGPTGETDAVADAAKDVKPGDIKDWGDDVVKDELVIKSLMESKGRNVWEAIDRDVKRGRDTTQATIDKIYTDYVRGSGKSQQEATRDFKEKYKGYFSAMDNDRRMASMGWREPTMMAGTAPTPGVAAIGGPAAGGTGGARPRGAAGYGSAARPGYRPPRGMRGPTKRNP